jgi:glycerol-3-phosphate acyltransferase PlsY
LANQKHPQETLDPGNLMELANLSPHNLLILLFSYLIGSIPFGLIIAKFTGIGDLRTTGSGNIGATNMLRTGGKKLAALTLLLDMLKGMVAVKISLTYSTENIAMLGGAIAVIGHIFPIWLKFRGGKGVATAIAVIITVNWQLGFLGIATWLITYKISKLSSLGSLIAFLLLPIFTYFLFDRQYLFYLSLSLSALVLFRHYSNIIRLINRQEKKSSL